MREGRLPAGEEALDMSNIEEFLCSGILGGSCLSIHAYASGRDNWADRARVSGMAAVAASSVSRRG